MPLLTAPARLALLCQQRRIRRLALFGSRLTGQDRAASDVDLLVEFEPGTRVTLLDMAQIELDLSPLYGRARRWRSGGKAALKERLAQGTPSVPATEGIG